MAVKKAMANYGGKVKELQTGDTLDGASGSNIAKTLLTPTGSESIADNTSGVTYGFYQINGSLSLSILGNSKFLIH